MWIAAACGSTVAAVANSSKWAVAKLGGVTAAAKTMTVTMTGKAVAVGTLAPIGIARSASSAKAATGNSSFARSMSVATVACTYCGSFPAAPVRKAIPGVGTGPASGSPVAAGACSRWIAAGKPMLPE